MAGEEEQAPLAPLVPFFAIGDEAPPPPKGHKGANHDIWVVEPPVAPVVGGPHDGAIFEAAKGLKGLVVEDVTENAPPKTAGGQNQRGGTLHEGR